jgi:hypothetical protein
MPIHQRVSIVVDDEVANPMAVAPGIEMGTLGSNPGLSAGDGAPFAEAMDRSVQPGSKLGAPSPMTGAIQPDPKLEALLMSFEKMDLQIFEEKTPFNPVPCCLTSTGKCCRALGEVIEYIPIPCAENLAMPLGCLGTAIVMAGEIFRPDTESFMKIWGSKKDGTGNENFVVVGPLIPGEVPFPRVKMACLYRYTVGICCAPHSYPEESHRFEILHEKDTVLTVSKSTFYSGYFGPFQNQFSFDAQGNTSYLMSNTKAYAFEDPKGGCSPNCRACAFCCCCGTCCFNPITGCCGGDPVDMTLTVPAAGGLAPPYAQMPAKSFNPSPFLKMEAGTEYWNHLHNTHGVDQFNLHKAIQAAGLEDEALNKLAVAGVAKNASGSHIIPGSHIPHFSPHQLPVHTLPVVERTKSGGLHRHWPQKRDDTLIWTVKINWYECCGSLGQNFDWAPEDRLMVTGISLCTLGSILVQGCSGAASSSSSSSFSDIMEYAETVAEAGATAAAVAHVGEQATTGAKAVHSTASAGGLYDTSPDDMISKWGQPGIKFEPVGPPSTCHLHNDMNYMQRMQAMMMLFGTSNRQSKMKEWSQIEGSMWAYMGGVFHNAPLSSGEFCGSVFPPSSKPVKVTRSQ